MTQKLQQVRQEYGIDYSQQQEWLDHIKYLEAQLERKGGFRNVSDMNTIESLQEQINTHAKQNSSLEAQIHKLTQQLQMSA